MDGDTLLLVQAAARKRLLFLPHAVKQMSRVDRMISTRDIHRAIKGGEILEDYPDDPRGRSCLLLGLAADGRPVHIVCAPRSDYLAVITAYRPDPRQWTDGLRVRKRK